MTDSDVGLAVQQFLLWEAASRDTIDFKKIYKQRFSQGPAGTLERIFQHEMNWSP